MKKMFFYSVVLYLAHFFLSLTFLYKDCLVKDQIFFPEKNFFESTLHSSHFYS